MDHPSSRPESRAEAADTTPLAFFDLAWDDDADTIPGTVFDAPEPERALVHELFG